MQTLLHAHQTKRISGRPYTPTTDPPLIYSAPSLARTMFSLRHRGTPTWIRVLTVAILNRRNLATDGSYLNSVKTYENLTSAGIPCTIVLDSAVAYVMDKGMGSSDSQYGVSAQLPLSRFLPGRL